MPLDTMIAIGVLALIIILVLVFFFPSEEKKRRRKIKKEKKLQPEKQRDWQAIVTRREHYIEKLKGEIAKMLKDQAAQAAQLEAVKAQNTQLREKLKLEHSWREKEEKSVDKNATRLKQLTEELRKAEENVSQEHAANIRLEKEVRESREELKHLNDAKRDLTVQLQGLDGQVRRLTQELTEERRNNRELSKKKEEESWVAKTDYENLQKILKEKERELERISRQQGGAGA